MYPCTPSTEEHTNKRRYRLLLCMLCKIVVWLSLFQVRTFFEAEIRLVRIRSCLVRVHCHVASSVYAGFQVAPRYFSFLSLIEISISSWFNCFFLQQYDLSCIPKHSLTCFRLLWLGHHQSSTPEASSRLRLLRIFKFKCTHGRFLAFVQQAIR